MKKTSSVVWQFFDRLEENKRCVGVQCKLCDREYKYFGNTTNLRVHLTKKHPIQWEMRQESYDGEKTAVREVIVQSDEVEIDQEDSVATMNLVRQMQSEGSDEEWLEEEQPEVEVFVPPTKRRKLMIKREAISPPLDSLHRYSSTPGKSTKSEHFVLDESSKDEYSVFGEYIANKLRKLKSPHTKGNVQQLITTILWQAEYGMYDDVNSVKRILMTAAQVAQPQSTAEPKGDDELSHELISASTNQSTNKHTEQNLEHKEQNCA